MKYRNTMYFYLTTGFIMSVLSISSDEPDIKKGNNYMSAVIYDLIKNSEQNLVFAPISLHSSLSMMYMPAVDDTLNALSTFLGNTTKAITSSQYSMLLDSTRSEKEVQLDLHNKIYSANQLEEMFENVATDHFYSCIEITKTNQVQPKFNNWISRHTKKKIRNFYKELHFNTAMLSLSTIYFESLWDIDFKASTIQTFYADGSNFVDCQMLERTGLFKYKRDNDLNAEVIQLPFRNNNMSMIIVLPNSKTGIADLESRLTTYDWNKIDSGMSIHNIQMNLPKFTFTSDLVFDETLQKTGLADAFTYGFNFNINLWNIPRTCLNNVKQEVFIMVHETGIKTAGACGIQVRALPDTITTTYSQSNGKDAKASKVIISTDEVKSFKANHPFIFMIRYQQLTLVFGKVQNPTT